MLITETKASSAIIGSDGGLGTNIPRHRGTEGSGGTVLGTPERSLREESLTE